MDPMDFLPILMNVCLLISGKGGPTWWEHLRTLVGGQLPQEEGNLLISEIRYVTNPHLVPGRGGVYVDSCITCFIICCNINELSTWQNTELSINCKQLTAETADL